MCKHDQYIVALKVREHKDQHTYRCLRFHDGVPSSLAYSSICFDATSMFLFEAVLDGIFSAKTVLVCRMLRERSTVFFLRDLQNNKNSYLLLNNINTKFTDNLKLL